jgi:uncharacterized surface protein with fasciclin (FAS1) repeats
MRCSFARHVVLLIATSTLLFACKKKFEEYYERPASLEAPIYQQLESRGKFTQFLALINKAGYKHTLSAAGYWTLFAPTDSAFQNDPDLAAYLQSRGITGGISAVDSATAQAIVQYLLVFNGFEDDRIDDYQSNLGWVVNTSFKRRTAYYTGFYKDTSVTGQAMAAIQSNRNNTGAVNSYYIPADNNNKYIPFFTTDYFSKQGLSSSDYTYFYPASAFSGFNVGQAKVNERNIAAENGVIHIIDRVVTPLPSIDQYLKRKPEFSEFRSLLDTFMVQFIRNNDATHRYQVLTGSNEDVYVKVFSNLLAYSPNSENYFKLQDNDGQRDGWTMVVPRNDSLQKYIKSVVLEYYPSLRALPTNIIADLLNAHMWQTTVWPSKFNNTFNFLGEPLYSHPQTNIIDKKVLSNGIFYGTTKVNEPNVFSTIYGKSYLNPKFGLMTRLLDMDLRGVITNPAAKYTMFMMSDAVLASQTFSFNPASNQWIYNGNGNDSNRLNLLRILNSSVVETPNGELDNIGSAGFRATVATFGGEVIKVNGNQVMAAGNKDRNITATIDSIKTAKNGRVVYLSNLLYFTYVPIGKHIEFLGTPAASEYNLFWNYLRNSTAYDAATSSIIGTSGGSFYTVFIPNNNAMRAAITAGLLPGTAATPNFNPTTTADKVLVEKFIQYHIIDKRTIIPDGKDIGGFPTLLKSVTGDPVVLSVAYPGNIFEVSDIFNRKARIVAGAGNELSNRTMIHLMDNYFRYN